MKTLAHPRPRAARPRPAVALAVALLASACGKARPLGAEAASACEKCHLAPPDTGAHRVHAQRLSAAIGYGDLSVKQDLLPDGTTGYEFGCGHCHPLDPALHEVDAGSDFLPDVVLTPPATTDPDVLKARNDPAAAYDAGTKTCSGVYCHSSGQKAPAYVRTPAWDAPRGALGCDGCHANPPRYASGGAGAGDANSHLVLADDGWESGHFVGLPGPWHTSKHGGNWSAADDAAPITCQACHADTVDPAAAGPSGFYWLDTTGDYHLPGGDPARLADPIYANLACATCHDGVLAAAGTGRVLPLRHVNGRRDVVFDPRTALPALSFLPASPNTPTRPYWVTNARPGIAFPDPAIPDLVMEGSTLSAHLGSARYDEATKTCSNVACHLAQTQVTWGAGHGFLACSSCHPF